MNYDDFYAAIPLLIEPFGIETGDGHREVVALDCF